MLSNNKTNTLYRIVSILAVLVLAACTCSMFPTSGPTVSTSGPPDFDFDFDSPSPEVEETPALSELEGPVEEVDFGQVPERDRYDLAARFKGITDAKPSNTADNLPKVGDKQKFWVDNTSTDEVTQITAELVYAGEHVAMWMEEGLNYDLQDAIRSAERFENETYPINRENFGSEPLPGIDGDPRVYILNSNKIGVEAAGYFNSPSQFPASIVPNSNEHEMFYMNFDAAQPGNDYYDSILAHEFQHMIQWNVDKNEDSWFNEGMSELAAFLNGYGVSDFAPSYFFSPETQLNAWEDDGDNSPHYGGSFLFHGYFLDRFGEEDLRELIKNRDNGLENYDSTLAAIDAGITTEDLFKDWMVANLLNDTTAGEGRYGYHNMRDLPRPAIMEDINDIPASVNASARQYGAQYIQISQPGSFNLHFEGAQLVRYLPVEIGDQAGSADGHIWWSGRGDDSDMRLTREIDLTNARSAKLEFDLWYAIEEGWDYGYLEVSPDGGQTWQIIRTEESTTSNPHSNAYGPGYSGSSGGWIHETASLDLFAGKKILLRFELITDDAVNLQGIALDNICIKDIDWCDDVEAGDSGWTAEGFVRTNNVAAQKYTVQVVITADDGQVTVQEIPLDDTNSGDLAITVGDRPATVIVSGLTRHTNETSTYLLEISDR